VRRIAVVVEMNPVDISYGIAKGCVLPEGDGLELLSCVGSAALVVVAPQHVFVVGRQGDRQTFVYVKTFLLADPVQTDADRDEKNEKE
jgi:hypothetical protein